jgi:hypothetical protein
MALDPFAPVRLGLRLGIGVVRFELRLVEKLLGLDREEPGVADRQPDAEPVRVRSEPVPVEPEPSRPAPVVVAQPPIPEPEPIISEPEPPAHIDVETELVGEFAEPGAEEGAGPEIHVDEPWEGYRRMRVADIRERVTVAEPAELAMVQLYEASTRGRRSILDAVERRSKELANAPR